MWQARAASSSAEKLDAATGVGKQLKDDKEVGGHLEGSVHHAAWTAELHLQE